MLNILLLRLFFLVIVVANPTIGPLPMFLVQHFPSLDLQRLLKHIVVVHELQELEIVGVGLAHAVCPIRHCSEENLSLQIRYHKHLEVLCLNFANCLVRAEETLLLYFHGQLLQAFNRLRVVLLKAILVVIVSDDSDLQLVEAILHVQ